MRRSALICCLVLIAAGLPRAEAADGLRVALADTLPLPDGEVTGLTWAGQDTVAMLIARPDSLDLDAEPQMFLVVGDTSGAVFWQEEFTGVLARGLAWDGEFFWSCGDEAEGGSLLYKIKADTVAVEDVYATPGHRPMGLAFDGRWLWIVDRDNGRFDRIDPETGDLTRSVAAPGLGRARHVEQRRGHRAVDPHAGLASGAAHHRSGRRLVRGRPRRHPGPRRPQSVGPPGGGRLPDPGDDRIGFSGAG